MGDTPPAEVEQHIGGRIGSIPMVGTGGLLAPVMGACLAVANGGARHVLVYRTVKMMGGSILPPSGRRAPAPPPPRPRPAADGEANGDEGVGGMVNVMGDMAPLLTYGAYSAANWLAMHAERHMYLYGTTKEQLGALAVNSRRNAAVQPARRRPRTDDDGRLPQRAAGFRSVRVARLRRAYRRVDRGSWCRRPTTRPTARAHPCTWSRWAARVGTGAWDQRPDYPKMASIDAAADLWSTTDLTPSDVDIAELYDGFTFLALAWLEALGFCGTGESGPFVEGGTRIALDGDLPLNTYGGQLSAGRMHGYWVLHEACLQLRGESGERQVEKAEVAAVAVGGGPIAGCMLLTR